MTAVSSASVSVPIGVERYPVYAPAEGPPCHSSSAAAEAQLCYDRAGIIIIC